MKDNPHYYKAIFRNIKDERWGRSTWILIDKSFEHKNHKRSKIDEIEIQKCCDEVLRKIDKPSKVKKSRKEEQSNA